MLDRTGSSMTIERLIEALNKICNEISDVIVFFLIVPTVMMNIIRLNNNSSTKFVIPLAADGLRPAKIEGQVEPWVLSEEQGELNGRALGKKGIAKPRRLWSISKVSIFITILLDCLPSFNESVCPDLVVIGELIDDVRRSLFLSGKLERGPWASDHSLQLLLPLLLGLVVDPVANVRKVATPRMVLGVNSEVLHKAHLVGKVEGKGV